MFLRRNKGHSPSIYCSLSACCVTLRSPARAGDSITDSSTYFLNSSDRSVLVGVERGVQAVAHDAWQCISSMRSCETEFNLAQASPLRCAHMNCVECTWLGGCKRAPGKTAVPELFSAAFTTVRVTACLTWPIGPLFESAAKENSIVV